VLRKLRNIALPVISSVFLFDCTVAEGGEFKFEKAYMWSDICDAEIRGKQIFCGLDGGLLVLDGKDLRNPPVVGQAIDGKNTGRYQWYGEMAVESDYVYMARCGGGLSIFNVAAPDSPTVVANYDGYITDVFVSRQCAYVAVEECCIEILDVSNPTDAQRKYVIPVEGTVEDVFVGGDYLFIVVSEIDREYYEKDISNSCLRIYDIEDGEEPRMVSEYGFDNPARSVFVRDGYAYVLIDEIGMEIIDVRNPFYPERVAIGRCATGGSSAEVKLQGSYAYLSPTRGTFCVFDISQPSNPKLVNDNPFRLAGCRFSVNDSIGIFETRDFDMFSEGWAVVDVSDPRQISIIKDQRVDRHIVDAAISGEYAYVLEWQNGMTVLDLRQRPGNAVVSHLDIDGDCREIMVYKDHAFVVRFWGNMVTVDISDPHSPLIDGKYGKEMYIRTLFAEDHYLFAGRRNFIDILDISELPDLRYVKRIAATDEVRSISIMDKRMYIGADDFQIFDVEDMLSPVFLGSYGISYPRSIQVKGDFAFIAAGKKGLEILNVRDPSNIKSVSSIEPGEVDQQETSGASYGVRYSNVVLDGDHAFVLTMMDMKAVVAIDISNPYHPFVDDVFGGISSADRIVISDGLIYVPQLANLLVLKYER
jgi:hypothetical protein